VTRSDGKSIGFDGKLYSLAETRPGHFIEGRFGGLVIDGRFVPLDGRDVSGYRRVRRRAWRGCNPKVCPWSSWGRKPGQESAIAGAVNSVAAITDGFLAGGSSGAYRITDGGEVVAHSGPEERGRVRSRRGRSQSIRLACCLTPQEKPLQRLAAGRSPKVRPKAMPVIRLARLGDGRRLRPGGLTSPAANGFLRLGTAFRIPRGWRAPADGVFILSSGQMLWVRDPPVLPTPSVDVRLVAPSAEGAMRGARCPHVKAGVRFVLPTTAFERGPVVSYFPRSAMATGLRSGKPART